MSEFETTNYKKKEAPTPESKNQLQLLVPKGSSENREGTDSGVNTEGKEKTDSSKKLFGLDLFNLGTDIDTLFLLGLVLLFIQEEQQDTLMVCILAYILLG